MGPAGSGIHGPLESCPGCSDPRQDRLDGPERERLVIDWDDPGLNQAADNSPAQFSSLARAAGGLSVLACVVAAFAFVREMALAVSFGAGASVDAYLVA